MSRYISETTQNTVRERANVLCEYCHANEQWQYVPFTVDHVIPFSKGGANNLDNLALACFHCNRQKSDKVTAFDEESKTEISLFNPRVDSWKEHFIWSKDTLHLIGITELPIEKNEERLTLRVFQGFFPHPSLGTIALRI